MELRPSYYCKIIPDNAFEGIRAGQIVVAEGFTECGINILGYGNTSVETLTLLSNIYYQADTIGFECTSLSTVEVCFDEISVSYAQFNRSYMYTQTLVVRTGTLTYPGFLANENNYAIYKLRLYADAAVVTLNEFINGTDYETAVNPTDLILQIEDEPSGFTDGYDGNLG